MRDLKAELELMNKKNPPMRTTFDYRAMVIRAQMAEAALLAKTEECERLRGQVKKMKCCGNCRWSGRDMIGSTICEIELVEGIRCGNNDCWELKGAE